MRPRILGAILLALSAFTACTREAVETQTEIAELPKHAATADAPAPNAGAPKHADIAGPSALKADARDLKQTVVTAHLEQKMEPGKNILWCGTFQLAWNELCQLAGGPIEMADAPPMVAVLNESTTTKDDLDEEGYVAVAGLAKEGVYDRIRRELKTKFAGRASPDLLESMPEVDWIAYAYLFKEFPFEFAFTRFRSEWTFRDVKIDTFGLRQVVAEQDVKVASQVSVIDHNDNDDFIVELKTQAKDERLILAKIQPGDTLAETIAAVERRVEQATPTAMQSMPLVVPVLNFDLLRAYSELTGHAIRNTNGAPGGTDIGVALQSIRFRLDERGAVLKSESAIAPAESFRALVFDKPFLILLKRRNAKNPYFALWVENAELLVSTKEN